MIVRRSIDFRHLQRTKWWALVRFARWLGVRFHDIAPHQRVILEWRVGRAIGLALG